MLGRVLVDQRIDRADALVERRVDPHERVPLLGQRVLGKDRLDGTFGDAGGANTAYQQIQFLSMADNYATYVLVTINGGTPTVTGTGLPVRSYLYMSDLVAWLVKTFGFRPAPRPKEAAEPAYPEAAR